MMSIEYEQPYSRNSRYPELVQRFPLRPLRSDEELDRAIAVVNELIDKPQRDEDENDYLDVLSDLVEKYETEQHPMPPVSDADMLRHLMVDARGVSQAELAAETGISGFIISEVLSSKRGLSRRSIGVLSRYFCVSPSTFTSD